MREPYLARSTGYTYSSGAPISVDLSFLSNIPKMDAPEIEWIMLDFSGTATTGATNTLPPRELCSVFQQVILTDQKGPRINALGTSLREASCREYGNSYQDGTTLAVSQTAQAVRYSLIVPFNISRLPNPDDVHIPLSDMLGAGASLQINTAASSGGALRSGTSIVSGTITVYAYIVDAGKPVARSRLVYSDVALQSADALYPINGLLVDAWVRVQDSALTATGGGSGAVPTGTAITTQNYTSSTLNIQAYPDAILNKMYAAGLDRGCAIENISGTTLLKVDDVLAATSLATNVYCMQKGQAMATLPNVQSLQVRVSGSIDTNERLVFAAITPRPIEMVAAALGFRDSNAGKKALESNGAVRGKNGEMVPLSAMPPELAKFLPLTVR